jgi:hypothetical protein
VYTLKQTFLSVIASCVHHSQPALAPRAKIHLANDMVLSNHFQQLSTSHVPTDFFFNSTDLLIIINNSIQNIIKITIKSLDHLATTTDTSASQRRAAVLTPPSPESGKAYRSRTCCSRQIGSHRAKALKDQRTKAATIANDDNRRLEKTDLKPHQQMQKPTDSREIRRAHDSTRPPPARAMHHWSEDRTERTVF